MIRFGSVCSGIEAASVAWNPLGWKAAWVAEIEPFPSAVLHYHYADVDNLGDMTALPDRIRSGEVEAPDLFCGGTPCQAFSVAGLRKSLSDERGNLSLVFCEIADAIDESRSVCGLPPAIVFWENVPGVLSTSDNAFGCFLAQLCGGDEPLVAPDGWPDAGCVSGPKRTTAWRVLDAQYFLLAQRRRRVFVVASARAGFDPAAVLFEFAGVRRDTPPSRETGKRVAPTIAAGSPSSGGYRNDADTADSLIALALRGEGFDASEDGTGRGTPLVPVASALTASRSSTQCPNEDTTLVPIWRGSDQANAETLADCAGTLNCNKGQHGGIVAFAENFDKVSEVPTAPAMTVAGYSPTQNAGGLIAAEIAPVGVTIHGTDPTVQKVASYDDLAQCLRARTPGNIDNSSTTVVQQPIAFDPAQITSPGNRSNPQAGDPCHTLHARSSESPIILTLAKRGRADGRSLEVRDDGTANAILTPNDWQGAGNQTTLGASEHATGALGTTKTPAVCAPTLTASNDPSRSPQSSEITAQVAAVVEATAFDTYNQTVTGDATQTLCSRGDTPGGNAHLVPAVQSAMQVRRLTPTECERLQGFPDGYTAIPWRGKPASECPDGPRYKALGNSWAVPVVRWIGQRIHNAIAGGDQWN